MLTDPHFGTAGAAPGPAVDSPEFWRRAQRTPVSHDPDIATGQVIRRMCELAAGSATDPVFLGRALQAVRQFRGGPLWAAAGVNPFSSSGDGRREAAIAESAWWFAKVYLRFVHHSRMIWDRLRERDQWQLLISPDVLVRMWPMKGDCAVYSTLIAAILQAWRVPWEFVTVAADPEQPSVYSHVYVRAILPDGRRLPLDASHGAYPGWRVPARDVFRCQVWDSAGRPVADAGAEFRGLHYYARRRGGLRGLGAMVCDDMGCYDSGSTSSTALPSGANSSTDLNFPWLTQPTPIPTSPGTVATPPAASGGTNWGNILPGLLNQWTQIGGKVIAPTVTYTRGPGGTLTYSAPAGSAISPALLPGAAGGGSSLLLLGGLGVGLVLLVAMFKGGK